MSAAALSGATKEHAMIDAAIVGLGRWGKAIVEAVQGKSTRLRFVRGVSESPGGGMTGAGLHILDAFVNLAGPVREVDARLFRQKPPPDPRDVTAVMVEFAGGATGTMATVRAGPAYWRVHVFGTRGWAEVR